MGKLVLVLACLPGLARAAALPDLIDAVRPAVVGVGSQVWTVAGGKDYAGKPRPVVIVQEDSFDATESITVCAFTTDDTSAPLFRLLVEPNERNGLRAPCRLMVDKITTVRKAKLGTRIGRLDDENMVQLNQAIALFLGLAVSARSARKGTS